MKVYEKLKILIFTNKAIVDNMHFDTRNVQQTYVHIYIRYLCLLYYYLQPRYIMESFPLASCNLFTVQNITDDLLYYFRKSV